MANEEHLQIIYQGVRKWNDWRCWKQIDQPDLGGSDLAGIDLRWANLRRVNFAGANLSEAILDGANLTASDLTNANLRGAGLDGVDFSGADLTEADLTDSSLILTRFTRTIVRNAKFSQSHIGLTTFADTDLSTVQGLDSVIHRFQSTIGSDTLLYSRGMIPESFLRGAGLPDRLIELLPSLIRGSQYHSCFISHSIKDKRFCDRLNADLQENGVRTWYFPHHASGPIWEAISPAIEDCGQFVLVCSENSLQSRPVKREIERACQREDKENSDIILPIRIDDYISKWKDARCADINRNYIHDFTHWDDEREYKEALNRLLKALVMWP